MREHYLGVPHQQCLTSVVREIPDKRSNSFVQELISKQHQRIASECLPRIESELQLVALTNKGCLELNSKKQIMDVKVVEIRDNVKKYAKDLADLLERIQSVYKVLTDMNDNINEIKSISVTGPNLMDDNDIYTWKVSLILLLSEESLPIYLEPFQTSQGGYKIGTSIDIETDEKSGQRYVIVSFIIFRGVYDSILQWPFPYPVTFCLVDLVGTGKNIIRSIKPDSRTAIFGRPLDNANTPYRIPDFCPLEKLRQNRSSYVSDDNIFVRLYVHFTETDVHPF